MTHRPLPIMRPLAVAYRDWPRTLLALRMLVAGAFLILVAFAAIEEFVPQSLWGQNLTGQALDLADDAIWAMLLTPVVIAIHRFVIQGIITSDYTLPLGDPVYRKVFVWLFALKVLSGLPFDLLGAMQMLGWPLWASTLGFFVALVAAIGLSLRLTILLPALAVQAPGAMASHALADSKGRGFAAVCDLFSRATAMGRRQYRRHRAARAPHRGHGFAADDDRFSVRRPSSDDRADPFSGHHQPRFSVARRRSQSPAKTCTGTPDQALSPGLKAGIAVVSRYFHK